MNIYILFWVKPFGWLIPHAHVFKYENVAQNTFIIYTFQDENESKNI
jgi:hypothetical protein